MAALPAVLPGVCVTKQRRLWKDVRLNHGEGLATKSSDRFSFSFVLVKRALVLINWYHMAY